MTTTPRRGLLRQVWLPALATGLVSLLPAQTAAPAPSAASAKPEEVITLSPFEVSTAKDVGYVANNTLAGSRLRTNLGDVANAISVYTPEFMSDILATDESDLMRYSASSVPERTDQTPAVQGISMFEGVFRQRIRGQAATRSRNYFETNLLPDTYNSERFEEARGPNAILFGLGGAGGLLNTTTKRARTDRAFTEANLLVGSWRQKRGTLDHNQPLNDKLALRLNGVLEKADGWHPDDQRENRRLHLAAVFKPWARTTLRAEYELGRMTDSVTRSYTPSDFVSIWARNGRALLPSATQAPTAAQIAGGIGRRNADPRITFIGNDGTVKNFQQTLFTNHTVATGTNRSALLPDDWAAIDGAAYPYEGSFFGAGGYVNNKQSTRSLFFETEPVKDLFLEFAYNRDSREHTIYDYNINVMEVRGEPAQTFRDGTTNPYAGRYYIESFPIRRQSDVTSDRYRLTATYTFDFGKRGRHNLAGLLSRDESENPRNTDFLVADGAPFNAIPSAVQNRIWSRTYIENPGDPASWSVADWRRIPQEVSVVLNAGQAPTPYRTTWATESATRPVSTIDSGMATLQSYWFNERVVSTAGFRRVEYSQTRGTGLDDGTLDRFSYGVVAKPTSAVSLYYNYSENALVPTSVQTLIPNDTLFPVNSGEGQDYGVMLSLLKGRVFVRAGYFEANSVDQAKAAGVGPNIRLPHERITTALVGAGRLTAAQVPVVLGGDFDLADVESDGYELNVTANLTDAWRLLFNASKSDSVESNLLKVGRTVITDMLPVWQTAGGGEVVTSSGLTVADEVANVLAWRDSFLALEGDSTVGHRELQLRLFTRYDIKRGPLKGLFFGGGFSYSDAAVIGKTRATGAYITTPVQREADVLLGYQFRLPALFGRKANVTLQFNGQDLLQQNRLALVRADTDGQIFRGVVMPPRRFLFNAKISF